MSLFLLCEEARPHHGLRFHVSRFIPDTDFLFPPLALLLPARAVPAASALPGQQALRQEPLAHLAQRPTTSLQLRLRWPGWRLCPCFSEHGFPCLSRTHSPGFMLTLPPWVHCLAPHCCHSPVLLVAEKKAKQVSAYVHHVFFADFSLRVTSVKTSV